MLTEEGLDVMVRFLSHPLPAMPDGEPLVEENREHIRLKRDVPGPLVQSVEPAPRLRVPSVL